MDDRTKGIGSERTTGREEDTRVGRVEQPSSTRAYEAAPGSAGQRSGSTVAGESGSRTGSTGTASADPRTHQIRADIERTRDDMSETIDAIQDRLRPSTIASNAAASVREAASDRIQDVADSEFVQEIRANPAPTIMIGIGLIGLAWLAWGGGNGHSYDTRGRFRSGSRRRSVGSYSPREEYYRGREWRGDAAGGDSPGLAHREETTGGSRGPEFDAGGVGSQAREYGDDTRRALRQSTRRAQNGLQRMMHQNPLLVGAAAAAVGAVIGMALPESERENQLMGEARDQVVDNVQSMAKGAAERVQNAASEAVERVQNVASESVGLATDTSNDKQ